MTIDTSGHLGTVALHADDPEESEGLHRFAEIIMQNRGLRFSGIIKDGLTQEWILIIEPPQETH